ncbi:type VI secretion system amidase effector protein Tae4 [Sansalvadorimonas sp. 2012CJ34-2]|uniref:Type VI secretion system amidase effector protein Tae4 n=1 Tax=Parendozoicomonas callyspongiae TaxID=2942213 RepID=A0ABT0PLF7_9GAMM|nr:type VI secretion system amidase effector protein Tae4 [Sansalvadorimonas sp. 2012CJ34-2]MCL6272183.1 type VI secretion system amidase effector protein Tae4 [Sansalvadorimonas sp. 2012CJ34-2]
MKFSKLWDNHPSVESTFDDAPCLVNGKRAFENQCAIRLGESLRKSGVSLETFKGAKCWHKHNPAHILRAEELANWLKSPFSPFKKRVVFEGVNGFDQIKGKTGIIFFKDYYGPGQQGDHIDLWNGIRLTKYSTWFEFAFRGGRHYSDATVWFWPVQ